MSSRSLTEILPGFLFVGDSEAAQNVSGLNPLHITHMLNLAPREVNIQYSDQFHLKQVHYPSLWDPPAKLVAFLQETVQWITDLQGTGSRVLVHCRFGANRSTTIVIAALMTINSWTLKQAFQTTKELHPQTEPFPHELIA